jgi:hypothetical protein
MFPGATTTAGVSFHSADPPRWPKHLFRLRMFRIEQNTTEQNGTEHNLLTFLQRTKPRVYIYHGLVHFLIINIKINTQ